MTNLTSLSIVDLAWESEKHQLAYVGVLNSLNMHTSQTRRIFLLNRKKKIERRLMATFMETLRRFA
jgi:hypothetical protein